MSRTTLRWSALLILAALALAGCRPRPEWTTDSEAALAEFQRGLDASMKFYHREARSHFETALELDPEFVTAKLFLLDFPGQPDRREELLEDLRQADTRRLTERERFLLEHSLTMLDGETGAAERMIEEYLARYPDDPWALAICSRSAWMKQDLQRAESHFRRLLETNPNWVMAQNSLGYLAMARGDFESAEEMFRTYAFIAPDQANPHDSLGELLTLLGRYDEARTALERALAIKADFCASYEHLQLIDILRGQPRASAAVGERARQAGCDEEFLEQLRCQRLLWGAQIDGDWEAPWRESWTECVERMASLHLVHRMALFTGRAEEAAEVERRLRQRIREKGTPPIGAKLGKALLLHLEGLRAAYEEEMESASERFEQADRLLVYWGDTQGMMKLYNRLHAALALEELGKTERSRAIRAQVEEVNAEFAELYGWLGEQLRRARAERGSRSAAEG